MRENIHTKLAQGKEFETTNRPTWPCVLCRAVCARVFANISHSVIEFLIEYAIISRRRNSSSHLLFTVNGAPSPSPFANLQSHVNNYYDNWQLTCDETVMSQPNEIAKSSLIRCVELCVDVLSALRLPFETTEGTVFSFLLRNSIWRMWIKPTNRSAEGEFVLIIILRFVDQNLYIKLPVHISYVFEEQKDNHSSPWKTWLSNCPVSTLPVIECTCTTMYYVWEW